MSGTDFESHRQPLFAAAYRMLGTRADAEDVLQEAWLRWNQVDHDAVNEPRAYLFRLVTRLALDQLRRVKARREAYVGPWLPEPLITAPGAEDAAELAESVSMGLLVVLETLAPVERAVFVLHEAFGFSHAEIADMLGRTERAVRQLAYRARQHVQARRPRHRHEATEHRQVTERFLAATLGGDLTALLDILAPDVTLVADANGKSETPRQPVHGVQEVAGYLVSVVEFWPSALGVEITQVNGGPGAVITTQGQPFLVFALDIDPADNRLREINALINPDKLAALSGQLPPVRDTR
ncbi:RNA polymerase sigma factor SigJ [Saccharopolyspora shandongensis]|uniref:RNA polymerase sigma factor SigJ n=1 Tax=Saccharopolyspora shandongensis TaxID=418495 RepID=UPI0033DE4A5B